MKLKQELTKDSKNIIATIFILMVIIKVATLGYELGQWLKIHLL